LIYKGDWYLLRAKFRNDSIFLVREIGRGRDVGLGQGHTHIATLGVKGLN